MKLSILNIGFFLVLAGVQGQQQQNITVDESNLNISYSPPGAWSLTEATTLDYPFTSESSHALSTDPNATATFTFTGAPP
jgi:hypothetical protein